MLDDELIVSGLLLAVFDGFAIASYIVVVVVVSLQVVFGAV
jgi:hypothetical protein